MLTFEINKNSEQIEIHGDKVGFIKLAEILMKMAEKGEADHRHLMTIDWGGEGLGSEKQGLENELCHHVKLFFWK